MSPAQAHVHGSMGTPPNIRTQHRGGDSWSRFYRTSRFPCRIQRGRWQLTLHARLWTSSHHGIFADGDDSSRPLARPWQGLPNFPHGLVMPGEVEAGSHSHGHIPPGTRCAPYRPPPVSQSPPFRSHRLPSAMPQQHQHSCTSLSSCTSSPPITQALDGQAASGTRRPLSWP